MKKRLLVLLLVVVVSAISIALSEKTFAFQGEGANADCSSCHSLSNDDARKLLKADMLKADISNIKMSPIKGLWEIEVSKDGKKFAVYMDFAKKFLVEAQFIPLSELGKPPEVKRLDVSKIPLADAVIMGSSKAKIKVIVFDDVDCPYCKKLHEEIKKVLKQRKDVAFYIKMFPLDIHPEAYNKSKSILCNKKSAKLLDDAFAGKELPKANCETKEIDENLKLGRTLGIDGTPAIIFPDGSLRPGYLDAQNLLKILEMSQQSTK